MRRKGVPDPHADLHGHDARWPGLVLGWILCLLALIALAGASYLAVVSWQNRHSLSGCGGLSFIDCEHVLGSRWARWLGLPVSYPAAAVYGLLAAASFLVGPKVAPETRRGARFALVMLASLAAGSAIWFTVLLIFVLGKICLFCLLVHLCGLTIGVLLLGFPPPLHRGRGTRDRLGALEVYLGASPGSGSKPAPLGLKAVLSAAGLGVAGVSVLIVGQVLLPSKTYQIEEFRSLAAAEPDAPAERSAIPGRSSRFSAAPESNEPSTTNPAPEPRTEEVRSLPVPQEPPELSPGNTSDTQAPPAALLTSVEAQVDAISAESDRPGDYRLPAPPENLPEPAAGEGPRWVSLLDDKVKLDVYAHPVLGDPEAPHVVVEMFDYTCRHCRTQSRQMKEAQEYYGRQLSVVLLPTPLSPLCNRYVRTAHAEHRNACRYTKLALAVWTVAPEQFAAFHHWLMEGKELPSLEAAAAEATRRVGGKTWREARESPQVRTQIEHNVELYQRCRAGVIPKLLSGNYMVSGETTSTTQLREILEKITSIQPTMPKGRPSAD